MEDQRYFDGHAIGLRQGYELCLQHMRDGTMKDTCSTCRFWRPAIETEAPGNLGGCHRYPYSHVKAADDWCDEHRPPLNEMVRMACEIIEAST